MLTIEKRMELAETFKRHKSTMTPVTVDNMQIGPAIILHDVSKDTVNLSLAVLRYIETGTYAEPQLSPRTPFEGQEDRIRDERPTVEDVVRTALK